VHALHKLWRIASGQISDNELIEISESEDMPHAPASVATESKA
jgi:hypothetical protein